MSGGGAPGQGVLALGILAHDEAGSIGRMLESVLRQSAWRATPPERRQVVVYANACTDATAEIARSFRDRAPEIEVVETAEKGKSQGWNALQRLLRADAEWWLFADADVILHWRAVERVLAEGAAHPEAAVVSSTLVASARYVPVRNRGFLESARVETERWKDPRRVVSARFYAIRRDVARSIELPPGLLNEDLYLTRLIGSERIRRSRDARAIAREPSSAREIVRYQVRTRIGSFQARAARGPAVDSNKTPEAMARRTGTFGKLSWKAKIGKALWLPLRLWVEWRARRVDPAALRPDFWMDVGTAKLGPRPPDAPGPRP